MSAAMAAHLSVVTAQSPSLSAARQSVIHLYRDFQRGVPEIMRTHQVDLPMSMIRTKIREEFERHRDVKDLAVIDILLFKGRQEYQETMNAWKQETHIMRYFIKDDAPPNPRASWRSSWPAETKHFYASFSKYTQQYHHTIM